MSDAMVLPQFSHMIYEIVFRCFALFLMFSTISFLSNLGWWRVKAYFLTNFSIPSLFRDANTNRSALMAVSRFAFFTKLEFTLLIL